MSRLLRRGSALASKRILSSLLPFVRETEATNSGCIRLHPADGKGDGPFATLSQQVPNLARLARKRGVAAVIESGKGVRVISMYVATSY